MTVEPLPFGNALQSGYDEIEGSSPQALNVFVDARGAVRRRPGLSEYKHGYDNGLAPGAILGVYEDVDGRVWSVTKVSDAGWSRHAVSVFTEAGWVSGEFVSTGNVADAWYASGASRPTFAESEDWVVLATGGTLQRMDLSEFRLDALDTLAGASDVPKSTHVVMLAGRLVAIDLDYEGSFIYSSTSAAPADRSGWLNWTEGVGTAGVVYSDARPDPIVAMVENQGELWVLGSTSLQVYTVGTDGGGSSTEFGVPILSVTREYGCSAPYSVTKTDQSVAWLDNRRRLVVSDGRSVEVVSQPIQERLNGLGTVSDCFGYRVLTGQLDALVWTFPTEGLTLAYQKQVGWAEWAGWDGKKVSPFLVNCHHLAPKTGVNVVGGTDGGLYKIDTSATTDDGTPIPAYVTTGYLNRGTENRKHCERVRLVFRRGVSSNGSSSPIALLRWRDREGDWEQPLEVGLGSAGDTEAVVELASLGVYRRRQWKLDFNGTEEWLLVSATETFTVLDS